MREMSKIIIPVAFKAFSLKKLPIAVTYTPSFLEKIRVQRNDPGRKRLL